MKLQGDVAQSAMLYLVAAGADEPGIERLLEEAESIYRDSERRAATSILYQRYAELDPAAAVDHLLNREAGFDPNWLYAIFHVWARTDLEDALTRAAKLDDREREMAGTAIVRSRDDLPTKEREALGSSLNVQVAVQDPALANLRSPKAAERAWRTALAMNDRDSRQAGLYTVAQQWVRQDPDAAIRAIESLQDRNEREQLLQHALQTWVQKEPQKAVDWILERPPSYSRTQLLAGALNSIVRKQPATAMALMDRLSRAEKDQLLPQFLWTLGAADPQSALDWAEKLEDGPVHRHTLQMIASIFAQRNPDEAIRWAATLSGEHAELVMSQVIQEIAQSDPERASRMISQLSDGPQRKSAIVSIAQFWAQWDPRAALAWASKQSSADTSPEMYSGIFGQWAIYDPDTAVSQLSFLLDTDDRNAAIGGILETAYLEPDVTDQVFQRLEGADAKRQAAEQIYYRLREDDPQAAERYRVQAGIGDENGVGVPIVN